ncbi:hypothetical protein GGI07_002028 [Coemansia sp. Benny D115]|nr:hypothetical protein GGI07_002028 [Coemansia sp. Benny D115]
MPLYPAVQVLPLHIIQSIALYVSGTGDKNSFKWYARGIDSDRNKLLPLMATCHLWRSVISPLYYYTAAYGEGSSLYSSHKHQYRKLFIDEVAALGNHQHIRKLYFTVQVANLVDPGTAVKDLQELVDKYGSLKGVFDVELEFRNYRLPTYWHPETADENSVSGLVKLQNDILSFILRCLRVLKMDFDLEIMALLNAYDVFANGSFKMLESVQFGSSMRNHSSTGDQANQMLLKALNLSKTIKHVHVRNAWITNFQDTVYPSIVFSNTLRYLNLEGSRITVENAIMLLV